jgi:orotidine-5'-phosphate decarboxylase
VRDIPLERRLVLALDVADREAALDLYRRTKTSVGTFKIGLELFIATGPTLIDRIRKDGGEVFLDLKLHDIPNTVAAAVREASHHGVSWLTVHALGGRQMMQAAHGALHQMTSIPGVRGLQLLAVSILTHHTGRELIDLGLSDNVEAQVVKLVELARDAGIEGAVCSPEEIKSVRHALGEDFFIVTPGIRPPGAPLGDQARTATPFEAMRDGADLIVVGRPIRTAPDPGRAAADILVEIERGLAARGAS